MQNRNGSARSDTALEFVDSPTSYNVSRAPGVPDKTAPTSAACARRLLG